MTPTTWVELAGGGLNDGLRMQLASDVSEVDMPCRPVITIAPPPDPAYPDGPAFIRYRWDGTTKDGGVRVFRAAT